VIGYDPAGVDAKVARVRVEVQPGLHEAGDSVTVVPDGAPEADSDTDRVVPEIRPTVTVYDADCPAVTVPLPGRETEKSNGAAIVSVSVALPVPPLLVALNVTVDVAAAVGVPEINPVAVFSDKPAGKPLAP
jgi:hypothetical protein